MVNIEIKEKVARVFIPYEIVISVNNEDDHVALLESAHKLKSNDSYFFGKSGALGKVAEKIFNYRPK